MEYKNKVVVITGASRGIGFQIASFFAKQGCQLIITYNQSCDMSKNVEKLLKDMYNVDVMSCKCDLCKEDDIKNLVKLAKEKYGFVNILVNNAALSLDSSIDDKTKDEFMKVLETNVVGTFLMIKHFSKIISNGYIFNISSTDAIDTYSSLNIDYSASKAAINNMTKSMSLCFDSKIISICPNWVNTETIQEMNQDYLQSELKRINQKKLIEPDVIPKIIDKCIKDNVPSGSIIRIDGDINE